MMDLILNTAKKDDRVRAVYLSGPRVDPNATHDKYSDFDFEYCRTEAENVMAYLKEMKRSTF